MTDNDGDLNWSLEEHCECRDLPSAGATGTTGPGLKSKVKFESLYILTMWKNHIEEVFQVILKYSNFTVNHCFSNK